MEDIFSKNRFMVFPRKVMAGHDVISETAKTCREFGFSGPALIVSGETTHKVAGALVAQVLQDGKYEVSTIQVKEATWESEAKIEKMVDEVGATFLVAVGGGSKIDLAKISAHKKGIPFLSVPTSAAHDGIASPKASMKVDGVSKSMDAVMPLGIIADTAIIVKSPFKFLAAGCADVISNLTAIMDWELSERLRNETFSRTAATLAKYTAEVVIGHAHLIKPNVEESVWIAIKPIIMSGIAMSIAGSSRPTSGSEHMFSHSLDKIAPGKAMHGEQCGVGAIMMMYLHRGKWERIRSALSTIGAPTNAKELGVSEDDVINALIMAQSIRSDRYTILGDRDLSYDAAKKIAQTTKVI